jgi:hypothetical protein
MEKKWAAAQASCFFLEIKLVLPPNQKQRTMLSKTKLLTTYEKGKSQAAQGL